MGLKTQTIPNFKGGGASENGAARQAMDKIASAAVKASNSNVLANICLAAAFLVLCARSVKQESHIDALESEKESLVKSNKAMKKTMWDWKQQLLAEAATDSPLIPLSTLKSIYGDAPAPAPGEVVKAGAESSSGQLIV